jgi:preprotein translocase subunit YajC
VNFEVFAFQAVPDAPRAETAQPVPGSDSGAASAPSSTFGLITPLLILVPFIAILFFQNRSQAKRQEATIAGLKKGDKVITQSGLVGRLVSIEGRYAELQLPPSGTKVTILRSGLVGRDAEGESAPNESGADKSKTKTAD